MSYLVFHGNRRDKGWVGSTYHKGLMYDKLECFDNLDEARDVAVFNMPSILMKMAPLDESEKSLIKSKERPLVAAVKLYEDDISSDYYGGHSVYKVKRCSENELEKAFESLTKKGSLVHSYVGIELKVFDLEVMLDD